MATRVLQKTKGGVRMVRDDGTTSPLELDEPVWAPDENVTPPRGKDFGFFNRKHHCRRTGRVVCGTCTTKIPILRMAFMDPVRIHNDVVSVVQEENKFFAKELPVLVKGGAFNLESEGGAVITAAKCKLTPDHRLLKLGTIEIPSNAVHMIDAGKKDTLEDGGTVDVLTIKSKASGQVDFHSTDKDFAKKWRKAIKHMIKVLHADKKKLSRTKSSSSASAGGQ